MSQTSRRSRPLEKRGAPRPSPPRRSLRCTSRPLAPCSARLASVVGCSGMAKVVTQVPLFWPDARTVLRLASAALVAGSAILLFAVHERPLAYVSLVLGVALGWVVDRRLGKDLLLVAIGQ